MGLSVCFVFYLLECYVVHSVLHYLLLLSSFVCIPFLYNPLGQVSATLCISGCMDDILGAWAPTISMASGWDFESPTHTHTQFSGTGVIDDCEPPCWYEN